MPINSNVAAVGVINGTFVPVVVSVANTLRDGTGTLTPLGTAGPNGALLNRVQVQHMGAIGAASAALIARLWRTSGATKVLESEVALPIVTPTVSVPGASAVFPKTNISLKAGEILSATISVSEAVGFIPDQGGDY